MHLHISAQTSNYATTSFKQILEGLSSAQSGYDMCSYERWVIHTLIPHINAINQKGSFGSFSSRLLIYCDLVGTWRFWCSRLWLMMRSQIRNQLHKHQACGAWSHWPPEVIGDWRGRGLWEESADAHWWDVSGGNDEGGAGHGPPRSYLPSASFCSESGEKKKEEHLVVMTTSQP